MSTMAASSEWTLSETAGWTSSPWIMDNINRSLTGLPDDCVILGVNATVPWDNPRNLISQETEHLIDRLKVVVFVPILYLVGTPANLVNMVVFFKQGLKSRINMCLFSLALVDLLYLNIMFVFYSERIFTGGEKHRPFYRYIVNNNVMGLIGFANGPALLAAIISTERCFCVLFPLRAQRCIPTKVLAIVIVVSVSLLGFLTFVVTAQYRVTCFYEMRTERQSWQPTFTDYHFQNKAMLKALDGVFYGVFISVGCPVIVFITVTITVVKLQLTLRWRSQTSSSNVCNAKEIAVTKMLIALSIENFVISIPSIVLRVTPVFQPQINPFGHFANSFKALYGLTALFLYVNSSVNFFVYYFTSTKYKETLYDLLGWKTPAKKIAHSSAVSSGTVVMSLDSVK